MNQTNHFPHPFLGQLTLATLNQPREQFFGTLIDLRTAGITLKGYPLSRQDELLNALYQAQPLPQFSQTVFIPMHRLERLEQDTPQHGLPSLYDQLAQINDSVLKDLF
jgi:hypothetical protein